MGESLVFTAGDGTSVDLSTQPGYLYKNGVDGRFMPQTEFVSEGVPTWDGARLRGISFGTRALAIPVQIVGTDRADVRDKLSTLASQLHARRGVGALTLTREDGSAREIRCIFEQGLEGEDSGENNGRVQSAVFVFRAFDPFWYDTVASSSTYVTGAGVRFLGNPFFPMRLSGSTVFAQVDVDNEGDVEAWPQWTITGPGSALIMRNYTTGKYLSLTYTIPTGGQVLIDTTPGAKTVTDEGGVNLYPNLSSLSSLWSLAAGTNSISVELNGATSDTRVQRVHYPRYVSA